MEKYTEQLNLKLPPSLVVLIEVICRYEGAKRAELIREWIRDKLKAYQTNPRFKRYLRNHPEELKSLGGVLP